jgi:hypothetical protein
VGYEQELEKHNEDLEKRILELETEIDSMPFIFEMMSKRGSFGNLSINDKLVSHVSCQELKEIAKRLGFEYVETHERPVKAKSEEVWRIIGVEGKRIKWSSVHVPFNQKTNEYRCLLPHKSNAKKNIGTGIRHLVCSYAVAKNYDEIYCLYYVTKIWFDIQRESHTQNEK